MEARCYFFIYFMMILLSSVFHSYGKPLPKFSKHQIDKEFPAHKNPRNLQFEEEEDEDEDEDEEYESYIVLHYANETNYTNGFKNDYRNNISSIIKIEDNSSFTDEEGFTIPAGTEIEIHFNNSVNNLENFFSQSIDKNMANVVKFL